MCLPRMREGFIVVPSVSDGVSGMRVDGVQNVSATAGLSVNENLNQLSKELFENFIKR